MSGAREIVEGDRGPEPTPTAHGLGRVVLVQVTEAPLDARVHESAVAGPYCGAWVTFVGAVRDHDGGRAVRRIEYAGHPTAGAVLGEVAAGAAARPGVVAVAVSHRLGLLELGEAALVASVASAHRAEAFAALSWLVDEAKRRLPIWKRQEFADGSDEWVNCP